MKRLGMAATVIIVMLASLVLILSLPILKAGGTALNEPHLANAIWIEPSTLSLSTDIHDIGYRFNVTAWINVTDVQSSVQALTAWQLVIVYDRSMLNVTRCGYTQGGKSQFFNDVSTVPVGPELGALNSTHNFVMIGESWVAPGAKRSVPGYGSLSWIEFEVISKPAQGQAYTCIISLQTAGVRICKILDDELNKVPFEPYHALYRYGIYDAAITNLTPTPAPYKNVTGSGYCMNLSVTITNQGSFSELFNITTYANTTIIGSENVALVANNFTTIIFTWDTTGFVYGNYTISAYAWPVSGETNTGDNTFSDGIVLVTIPGDINGDTFVNAKDAVLLGRAFGSRQGEAAYSPNADVDGDTYINAKDAVILGRNFGQQW